MQSRRLRVGIGRGAHRGGAAVVDRARGRPEVTNSWSTCVQPEMRLTIMMTIWRTLCLIPSAWSNKTARRFHSRAQLGLGPTKAAGRRRGGSGGKFWVEKNREEEEGEEGAAAEEKGRGKWSG